MRAADIRIGETYEGAHGNLRRVVRITEERSDRRSRVYFEIVRGRSRARAWYDEDEFAVADLADWMQWVRGDVRRDAVLLTSFARYAHRRHDVLAAALEDESFLLDIGRTLVLASRNSRSRSARELSVSLALGSLERRSRLSPVTVHEITRVAQDVRKRREKEGR